MTAAAMTAPLLVIAPHPDDEVLGAGAIMARAADEGHAVGVVVVTDGRHSDPEVDPDDLVRRRRLEVRSGLEAIMGIAPPLLFLDQIDGSLSSTTPDTNEGALARFVATLCPSTILVTDPADAHPDHKAAFGLASRLISAGYGDRLQVMPISQRIDGVFERDGYDMLPVGRYKERKIAAIGRHESQIARPRGFSLTTEVQASFADREYLRTAFDRGATSHDAIAAAHFDAMFDASDDPWRYDAEPYERDRFRRTVAALRGRRYRAALELGCANGALTEQLAPLCEALLATDASAVALAAAAKRLAGLPTVSLRRCDMPADVPDGPFDLIVASDMLYYLGLAGVVDLMGKLDARAAPGARMLVTSYLGSTDTRLTGEMSSEIAIAHLPGWRRVHAERTDRVRIDVLDRG